MKKYGINRSVLLPRRPLSVGLVFLLVIMSPNGVMAQALPPDIQETLKNISRKYSAHQRERQSSPSLEQTPTTGITDVEPEQTSEGLQPVGPPVVRQYETPEKTLISPDSEAASEITYESRFSLGEELIFSLELGDIPLGDIFAIRSPMGYQVGLTEFSQLVDFAIVLGDEMQSAEGWFLSPDNTFSLTASDDGTLYVETSENNFEIPPGRYAFDNDIYVELADLEKWFSFETRVNESQLTIRLVSSTPFPIEKRIQRQNKRFEGNSAFARSVLPVKENGYQLLSVPLLDVQLSTRTNSNNTNSSYSILSSQDAAYFSSQVFLYGTDEDALVDARATLSRRSNDADLLGPLKMTEYEFGDVTPVNIGVGSTQSLGRGFRMSNARYELVDNRRVNLVGEVQVGWDVELYRNGVLIDNRTGISDGRYEFNDVELGYGSNNFELVFYGPQGQIERREESYYVDSNVAEKGEGLVQFSVVDSNRTVFGINDYTEDPEQLGPLVSMSYDYGLSDWLSVGVGAGYFSPEEGEDRQQLSFRTNLVLGELGLVNSIFQFDNDERRSMLHTYRTQVSNVGLDVTYRNDELLDDALIDDNNAFFQTSADSIDIRVSGTLFKSTRMPINYQNTWTQAEYFSGDKVEQFQNSLGLNSRLGSFSHGLIWRKTTIRETDPLADSISSTEALYGSLGYRNRFGKLFTRLSMDYQVDPVSEIRSVGTSLNYPISNEVTSELRYTYDVINDNDRYDLRLNWLGEKLSISGIANYSDSDDWSVNLVARFGLGYDRDTDTFFTSGRSLAQSGAVVVRMFEDDNLDNTYNEGERLLENVTVKAEQAFREETTDEEGLAVLKSLPVGRSTDIVIDESTLKEPGMIVSSEGFAVASRRGIVQQFDIPVVRSGELEGTLYWRNQSGDEQTASYVRMNLVNKEGEIVSTTRTEFDGYYLFNRVMPGNYYIEVDTSSGRQRGLTPERLKEVKISNRGDLITGIDVVLRELISADGYVAKAGEFTSLSTLKLYLNLLSRRVENELLQEAFYYQSKITGKFVLGLQYAETQTTEAENTISAFCTVVVNKEIPCSVDKVEFQF